MMDGSSGPIDVESDGDMDEDDRSQVAACMRNIW